MSRSVFASHPDMHMVALLRDGLNGAVRHYQQAPARLPAIRYLTLSFNKRGRCVAPVPKPE